MFEELFTQIKTIKEYQSAPLVEERLRYLVHYAERGASRYTLRAVAANQLSLVRLLDLRGEEGVCRSRVEAAAKAWSRPGGRRYARPASSKATLRFIGDAVRWLRFLGRLREPEKVRHAHAAEVAAYEAWMRSERGWSEATIRCACWAADQFFDWLAAADVPLASARITDIDRIVAAWSARKDYSRRTVKDYVERLRDFIRFAEDRGWCARGMALALVPPKVYLDEHVPAGLNRKNVLLLLATTEGDQAVDQRDRAILMLFIAYGLRAGEVSGLRLDDLDWENETLRVRRPKTGRTHLFPLSRGVAEAVLRYILNVRPSGLERNLFFTLRAPFRPLRRAALWPIVSRRIDRLGIVVRHRGPHALRHSAAQYLLDRGMSYKVIGDFLGHRNPSSTAVYARSDLNALREVANFDLEGLV